VTSQTIEQSAASMPVQTGVQRVPLNQIRRNPLIDPRRGRNKAKYESMRASIQDAGVLQAILLRPIEGADVRYEVVFGNTRFDASCEVGLLDIPADIRPMSDAEARMAAAIENLQRADLTPIEEAFHAVVMLADHNNDHAEVCRVLGWSRTKLDSRVLLSKCCDEVADALLQGDLKLGHAELLAPMTHDDQRTICAKIIERSLSVIQTRDRLMEMNAAISTAPFDTTDCAGCQHNSGLYADLFSASIGEAKCQNRTCWDSKVSQLIDVRLIEAEKEFGVVHTDMTLPDGGYVLLQETGADGVGSEQFAACTGCATYGAVVSTKPGQQGKIIGGHCFNKACNAQHNTAYRALIASVNEAPSTGVSESPHTNFQHPTAGQGPAPATASGEVTAEKAKPQEVKKAIRKEAFGLYSRMACQAINDNPAYSLAISIVSLYLDMRNELPQELLERLQKTTGIPSSIHGHARAAVEVKLSNRPIEELGKILSQVAACTVFRKDSSELFHQSVPGAQSLAFIQAAGMDPAMHFKVTDNYLRSLTKAGIIADCKASGFDLKFDEVKGNKEFSKLALSKTDVLIKAILEFNDFSWEGYLPDSMKISTHTKPSK